MGMMPMFTRSATSARMATFAGRGIEPIVRAAQPKANSRLGVRRTFHGHRYGCVLFDEVIQCPLPNSGAKDHIHAQHTSGKPAAAPALLGNKLTVHDSLTLYIPNRDL